MRGRLALVLGLLAACPAQAARLDVIVEGIEPSQGSVYVTLCQGGLSGRDCRTGDEASAEFGVRRFTFDRLQPGVWAVATYQDANGNGVLDRTGLGIPLEPYGFSGATSRRGRPDFSTASFVLQEPGGSVRVRLDRALQRR